MKKAYVVAATFGDSEGVNQVMGLCAAPSSEVAVSWLVLQASRDGKANDPLMAVNSMEITGENLRTLLREIESDGGPKGVPMTVVVAPQGHDYGSLGYLSSLGIRQCVKCGLYETAIDDAPCRGTRELPPAG